MPVWFGVMKINKKTFYKVIWNDGRHTIYKTASRVHRLAKRYNIA